MNAASIRALVRTAVADRAPVSTRPVFTTAVKAEMVAENVTDLAISGVLRYGEIVDGVVHEDGPGAWRCVMRVSGDALCVEIGLQQDRAGVTVSVIGIELKP